MGCVCVLLLAAVLPKLHAREVMSWVPPYGIDAGKAVLQSRFGDFSPSNALTRLGLQFWIPAATGNVVKTTEYGAIADDDITWFRNWGRTSGAEVLLCIYNSVSNTWNWDLAVSAFSSNRAAFVSNLVETVEAYDLDGIDVDLEGIVVPTASDRSAFKMFLEALSAQLRPRGKVLTVDSFHSPLYNAPNMSWWPDWTGVVDTVHSMGYTELYEGSTVTLGGVDGCLFRYSWQQNYGVEEAGLAPDRIAMGLPGWTAYWGAGGRGSNVLDHIHECVYDCAVPAPVAIWDIQLLGTNGVTHWRSSAVWERLEALSRYESVPVDADSDHMADAWEITYFGGTNAVDGGPWDDRDDDGFSNLAEYVAGTDPTNDLGRLRVQISEQNSDGMTMTYPARCVDRFDADYGDLQRCYWLEHCTDLMSNVWNPLPPSTNIPGNDCVISYTNVVDGDLGFYRVAVELQ